jgi:hypothetical protein
MLGTRAPSGALLGALVTGLRDHATTFSGGARTDGRSPSSRDQHPVATLVAGVTLVAGASGGLYVQVAGIIACIPVGVLDAWALLVEILR